MLTQDLARFVVQAEVQDTPSQAIDAARDALLDTIGCALAAKHHPASLIAAKLAKFSVPGVCSLWGRALRVGPVDAAFANGVQAHALDFDDSLPTLRGHPSAPILAAAIAVAEMRGRSGRELLAAYAVAVEVAGTIGPLLGEQHYLRGWHSTATVGAFSATAAAGRLLGIDVDSMCHAFGLAAAQSAGLLRNFGTMGKPFQAGQAARSGVIAAFLASEGMTADAAIFDGDNSFIQTYGGDEERSRNSVISPWKILDPGIYVKRWPCCYASHRPLAGIFELIERHGIIAQDIVEVGVGFMPGAATALIHTNPVDGLSAKFSIEYTASAAILDGQLGLKSFTDEMVQRPAARALMAKVRRFDMPGEGRHYSGVVGTTDVYITTSQGRFEAHVAHTPGSPASPMTAKDRVSKFLDCTFGVVEDRRAKQILELIENCDSLPSIDVLTDALGPD